MQLAGMAWDCIYEAAATVVPTLVLAIAPVWDDPGLGPKNTCQLHQ
jgi:hypothetical protein